MKFHLYSDRVSGNVSGISQAFAPQCLTQEQFMSRRLHLWAFSESGVSSLPELYAQCLNRWEEAINTFFL